MEKLSETVERKFIESFDASDFEVMTDDGWKDIKSSNKTIEYEVWELKTDTFELKCADNHIVFDENMNEVFVKDLKPGQKIQTEIGFETVVSVEKLDCSDNMYDLELCDDTDHRYYTNGILSHNSTMYCIYTLWLTCFFPEKRVMILANKATTALELLGRIELGYSYLPAWLKPRVTVYNKGEMMFSNKSGVKGFASSSDAARGWSANCVDLRTKITIRFKTGILKKIKFTIPIWMLRFFGKKYVNNNISNEPSVKIYVDD